MAWKLPRPSGPLPVGCLDVVTKTGIDGSLFRLYYPTKPFKPSEKVCPLWLPSPEYGQGYMSVLKFDFASRFFNWIFGYERIPVLWEGPLVMPDDKPKLPLVLFSHGLAANRTSYSYIGYELASHGFFVAAVEHRDHSASLSFSLEETEGNLETKWIPFEHTTAGTPEERGLRNKQVYQRADEMIGLLNSIEMLNNGKLTNLLSKFDLASFRDKIDVEKCAVVGHSFGGAASITSLVKDNRFKAGITLDVWMFPLDSEIYCSRIEKPILFINSEAFQWPSNVACIRKLDNEVTGAKSERCLTTLKGTVHHTQCDFAFLIASPWLAKMIKMRGPTDPKIANDVNMKLILGFLRKHLGLPEALEVQTIIEQNPDLVITGSNVEISEEKVRESKEKLQKMIKERQADKLMD